MTNHELVEEGKIYKDAAPMSCSTNPEIFSEHMRGSVKNSMSLYIFGARAANVSGLAALEYEAEAIPMIKDEYEVLLKAETKLGNYVAILERKEKEESVSLKRRHSIA